VFRPDLAEAPDKACFLGNSRIEIVDDTFPRGSATHVIFDHDGTISNLRRDWEPVMEQVMLEGILGGKKLPEAEEEKIRERVLDYIDQSTGVQMVEQMQTLVEMVAEYGIVPPEERLAMAGYKEIYTARLHLMVNARLKEMESGKVDAGRYIISGAVDMLRELRARGATLYLASGTDREDVIREANRLGYAEFFNGGIHGGVGDVKKFNKRMLIENLIGQHGIGGAQLLTFGDGPVELSETVKHGGVAVGVASDEATGRGINLLKRPRLIRAGAHLVIGDYEEAKRLIGYLTGEKNL
jgi:phosphoglycolate phosphatase-like HAD superfamily hydrolase